MAPSCYRPPPDLRPAPPLRRASRPTWTAPVAAEPTLHRTDTASLLERRAAVRRAGRTGSRPTPRCFGATTLHYFDDSERAGRSGARAIGTARCSSAGSTENPPGARGCMGTVSDSRGAS